MGPFAMPRHPKYTFSSSSYAGSIVAELRMLSGVLSISLFDDFGRSHLRYLDTRSTPSPPPAPPVVSTVADPANHPESPPALLLLHTHTHTHTHTHKTQRLNSQRSSIEHKRTFATDFLFSTCNTPRDFNPRESPKRLQWSWAPCTLEKPMQIHKNSSRSLT
jgi:hypothetical protein